MAIIGIDLGTTNSLVAAWQDGQSVLIPNSFGKYLTPSVVSVNDEGEIIVGETAKQRLISHPDKTASLFKRFMGTKKVYKLGDKSFLPEDLSALVLRQLKDDAELYLGQKVTEAIISVPAYFNDIQRSATKTSGQIAGLRVERIINEPSAAALAYHRQGMSDGKNLVFDFGGGTLDISVIEVFDNIVDILAVSGDNNLGGSTIDEAVVSEFFKEHSILEGQISESQHGILLKNAEACKISLTDRQTVFMVYRHREEEYTMLIDNEKLTQICSPVLMKFNKLLKNVLLNAGLSIPMVDNIILVGGSSRMPIVSEYLKHLTGRPVLSDIDPDCAVAAGLGTVAGIKARSEDVKDTVMTDICPFSLGVEVDVGNRTGIFDAVIPRNSSLPISIERPYTTVCDNQSEICFKIYQGEAFETADNLFLGECTMPVPPMPAHGPSVLVRFTYDINGILEVEAFCEQTGERARKLIVGNSRLSKAEIDSQLEKLAKVKAASRDNEENNLLIAHGKRLYEEFSGIIKSEIMQRLIYLEAAINDSNIKPAEFAMMRDSIQRYFAMLDDYSENLLFYGQSPDGELDGQTDWEEPQK
ncbi:MAG: Hsp70 family protein [Oscillospiraceae bacterium]|nr:Hsp70 family protein [Oscillospiraceae bacterium]